MIQPGTIVSVTQTATRQWVVIEQYIDGRWRLISPSNDGYEQRLVGEGDMTEIEDAPIFAPGDGVIFNGKPAHVLEDQGETVKLEIPEDRFLTQGGEYIKIPVMQADASKANLVLETLL